jgi:catechol 2,3-dioxygenase-like lactoylglutathione lyase family enzyme
MTWALHRVSLTTHDIAAARSFFGTALGLGQPRVVDQNTITFGPGSRGVRICKPQRSICRQGNDIVGPTTARHLAIEVSDLNSVAQRLDKAGCSHVEAPAGDFDCPAIYAVDPAFNVVAFCQAATPLTAELQPWEQALGWGLHHVNLSAGNVREAVAFYTEIAGLPEGKWQAPAGRGDFSIDPRELAILPLSNNNRGIHIIRPDAGFAHRNNFPHNPSIGGHPAIYVKDALAVKQRLTAAGTLVSDAGVYAMVGMHQIYVLDPTANMIEVNHFV